ncbi:hypothetical protein ACEWY4_025543 [Coilia grayii]|uniref:P2X purinoreceptor 7 intracellular domain-containing protein n=1 Tax=Coilia grayii TaxID=363190 RepID=A0ABD1IXY9_9TELE
MPSEAENICCLEIPQVVEGQLTCVVDHPGLEPVCLNVTITQISANLCKTKYQFYRLSSLYRYLSYRSFVSWCWGFLGRKIRVVNPACVVLRIHSEFPDEEGHYEGFKLHPV